MRINRRARIIEMNTTNIVLSAAIRSSPAILTMILLDAGEHVIKLGLTSDEANELFNLAIHDPTKELVATFSLEVKP